MNYWNFLYNEIKVSKAYRIMALIVLISLSFIILFGPKVAPTPIGNMILWAVYLILPATTNVIGGIFLQYHNQENNILAMLGLLLMSYFIILAIIVFSSELTVEAIRISLTIYGIISAACIITLKQILKIENLINIEKKYCPEILKAIPLPKRGDLWGLQANDHYVNIITSKGSHLVYSSLAGAIDNSTPVNGVRIHRSYWVSQDGLKDITRKNNRYICILKNGMEISASRKGVEEMRRLEWIQ